jgi:hypothetical protein
VTWALPHNIPRVPRGQQRRVGVFATKKLVHE